MADLAAFFEMLVDDGAERFFHPHPFDAATAKRVCCSPGEDVYVGAFSDQGVIGYGMLRGYSEGYEVPSLGIAIVAQARGTGVAQCLMLDLHERARERGSLSIRLKVFPENLRAVALYSALGYVYDREPSDDGQMIGWLSL